MVRPVVYSWTLCSFNSSTKALINEGNDSRSSNKFDLSACIPKGKGYLYHLASLPMNKLSEFTATISHDTFNKSLALIISLVT